MRNETVYIDTLATSRTGDRKLMQTVKTKYGHPKRKEEEIKKVQRNIYPSKTIRKDLIITSK